MSIGPSERFPLITARGRELLAALTEHPHAPVWNHVAGDRIDADRLAAVRAFDAALGAGAEPMHAAGLADSLIAWIAARCRTVPLFRRNVPAGIDLRRDWSEVRTTSRDDLAQSPEAFVPDDADLGPMLVYRTAGTTGHALLVPHHPVAVACYQVLLRAALGRWHVHPVFDDTRVACFLVGAQHATVTYPSVLAAWGGAGFAKLNLHESGWRARADAQAYFDAMRPQFLSGDPISFATMARQRLETAPAALVTTAVAMTDGLRARLVRQYGCPVIDWYSLTETGPIGHACPRGHGYHVLAHDLYCEAVDGAGRPVAPHERGEIAVTGGRNPYVPLLRYRTGDWGRVEHGPCECGNDAPRILDLEGRAPVLLRRTDGGILNPIDVSRVLREFPIVQHELVQAATGRVTLTLRPIGRGVDEAAIRRALGALFGADADIDVAVSESLGSRDGDKVIPYRSDILLED